MLALHPQLVDLSKMPATEAVHSPYSFLGNPRYGIGGVFHHSRLTPVEQSAGSFNVSANVSAQLGTQLIGIWTEKFAELSDYPTCRPTSAWSVRWRCP
jgi:hypothetical protein